LEEGGAAFLYLNGGSDGAAAKTSRIYPTNTVHEPFMRCLLGDVDLLENGQCLYHRFLNQESPCW
jgi:hypothetical protein